MYMTVIIFFLLESYSSRYCATGCLKNIRFMFESEKKMQICVHSAFSPENEKVRNCYIPFGKLNCHVLVRLNFGDFIWHVIAKYTNFWPQTYDPVEPKWCTGFCSVFILNFSFNIFRGTRCSLLGRVKTKQKKKKKHTWDEKLVELNVQQIILLYLLRMVSVVNTL